jgi:hypothetical protein
LLRAFNGRVVDLAGAARCKNHRKWDEKTRTHAYKKNGYELKREQPRIARRYIVSKREKKNSKKNHPTDDDDDNNIIIVTVSRVASGRGV